ncbi:MAG TPA: DNA gyrase modulator, partial [Dehalococcoidia bacterium]|nr:DNA gyrase modulator [Dehalococcoidia bacterium]
MEEVLALAKKVAEEAEVFSISYEDTPVQFEANRLKHLHSRQSSGCALRLIKNGRLGLAATNRLDEKEKLVQMALDVAQFGAEAKFQFPSRMEYPHIETYDPEAEAAPIEDMVHLGQSLIDRVLQVNPDILCEGGVTKHVATVRIINSRGGEVSYKKSVFSVGVEGTLIRGTDMLFVGDGESSCHRLTDITKVAQKTIRQLELAKNTVSGPSGQLPVIFTPQGVTALLMPLVI